MNNDWKQFLQACVSDLSGEAVDSKKAETTNIICNLSQFTTLVVAGEDAATFMQGQFTNDVRGVDQEHSQLSALCNNKGRMIANFRLFKHQQNYFINLKSDLADKTIQHLQNYILRANVALQDISEQLIQIGVSGDDATALLQPFVGTITTEIDSISHNDDYIVICIAGTKPRYEVFCSLDSAKTLWQKISKQADIVNPASWDYLNIEAGIPLIDAGTSEEFVPQMANMDLINGVSFTKGCFTGQEIVARMHYLGKLKKRCYKVHIDTQDKPETGDKLFAENASAGQNTGALITIGKNPQSGYDALAVIQIADIGSRLFLNDADGPAVTVKELPYGFESE